MTRSCCINSVCFLVSSSVSVLLMHKSATTASPSVKMWCEVSSFDHIQCIITIFFTHCSQQLVNTPQLLQCIDAVARALAVSDKLSERSD
jgi:hypothetical protein